jgi:hypothetical protein
MSTNPIIQKATSYKIAPDGTRDPNAIYISDEIAQAYRDKINSEKREKAADETEEMKPHSHGHCDWCLRLR